MKKIILGAAFFSLLGCGFVVAYYAGDSVRAFLRERGKEEAVACQSAEKRDAEGQYRLGVRYANGEGVEKNMEQAVAWYRKAAENGCAEAQYSQGVCYGKGEGVEKDMEQAVAWYRKAAEQGDATAQYNLGVCYANGEEYGKGSFMVSQGCGTGA